MPPSTVLMLFAKLKTFSEYESLYCSATSIVSVPPFGRSRSPSKWIGLSCKHGFAAVQVLDEFGNAAAVEELFGADIVAALIA